ncbi:MAG: hypothetical protein HY913_00090 [Desulfomonile tiedjei]|nr:hypothetical protein [Desulfomonile tiedjei]
MPLFLDTAKITPPRFPHILYRQRLVDRLEQHRDKKLILILGPAAQGKSTLALSYVMTSDRPSAWVNLGPEESDPVNLFYLLTQSLHLALPEVDFTAALQYPGLSFGPREELPLYRDWTLALLGRLQQPVQLILDGLDRLAPEAPSFRFLQVFLDCLPPSIHLVLLSREMPPLEIQALKMRQEAFILTGEELAFTLEETRNYLGELRQMSLPPDLLNRFQQLTEGWVGGLVLLSESLERVPETLRDKYLTGGLTMRFKEEIFRYFGECIFNTRPPQDQDFLLKSSILEVVDPDFIQGLLGLAQAREILEDLTRRNLFIQALHDPRKGWLFRYHQLFRSCLQIRFKTSFTKAEQQAVYLKAAVLFEQRGEPEEALKLYLKAQAPAEAAALLEKTGLDLLSAGRTGDLARWLEALPADLVQENPWLLFYRYMSRRFQGPPEVIQSLQQSLSLFDRSGDVGGVLLSLAYLIEASAWGLPVNVEPLLARAEEVLASPEASRYPGEKATLFFQIGHIHTIMYGNLRQGLENCLQASLLARDLGDLPLQINALLHASFTHNVLGEFNQAGAIIAQVDKLLADCDIPPLTGVHLLFKTNFYMFQGQFDRAEALNRRALEQIQRHGLRHLLPLALIHRVMRSFFQGRFGEADEVAQPLLSECKAMGSSWLCGMAFQVMGMSCYHRGEYLKAREFDEEALRYLSTEKNFIAMTNLLLSLVAYHLGEVNLDIEKRLQEALEYFAGESIYTYTIETHLSLALLYRSQGRLAEAALHLGVWPACRPGTGLLSLFFLEP